MEWKHDRSPTKNKFKITSSAGKVMGTIFWDPCSVILIEYLESGPIVSADCYWATFSRLREAIRRKRTTCWVMVPSPAWQRQAPYCLPNSRITAKVQVGSLEPPTYRPDLAPSVYLFFPKLKEHLSGTRFSAVIDLKTAVENWSNGQGRDSYQAGLNNFILRSDKCTNKFADYVVKLSASMLLNSLLYFLFVNKYFLLPLVRFFYWYSYLTNWHKNTCV